MHLHDRSVLRRESGLWKWFGDLVSGSGAASGMDIRLLSGVLRLLYGTGVDLISGKL